MEGEPKGRVIWHGDYGTLEYPREDGRGKNAVRLDAETEGDAKYEAAAYLGCTEEEIVVEYD